MISEPYFTETTLNALEQVKSEGGTLFLGTNKSYEDPRKIFSDQFIIPRDSITLGEKGIPESCKLHGVFTDCDEWVSPLVAHIAESRKLPGNTLKTAYLCRNKFKQRQALKHLPGAKFFVAKDFDSLIEGVTFVGGKAVAKPLGGFNSCGTFFIDHSTDKNSLKALYEASRNSMIEDKRLGHVFTFSQEDLELLGDIADTDVCLDYIVEEFIEGPQVSIDSFVSQGEIIVSGIALQERMKPPFFMQVSELMPFEGSKEEINALLSLNEQAIKSLGINQSAVHAEYRITNTGPRIIELACRFGGDNIADSIFQTTGLHLCYEVAKLSVGLPASAPMKKNTAVALEYIMPTEEGYISELSLTENVQNECEVTEFRRLAERDDFVAPPPKGFVALGYIQCRGDTLTKAKDNLSKAVMNLKIKYEKNSSSES